jgi:hypothetical protein
MVIFIDRQILCLTSDCLLIQNALITWMIFSGCSKNRSESRIFEVEVNKPIDQARKQGGAQSVRAPPPPPWSKITWRGVRVGKIYAT